MADQNDADRDPREMVSHFNYVVEIMAVSLERVREIGPDPPRYDQRITRAACGDAALSSARALLAFFANKDGRPKADRPPRDVTVTAYCDGWTKANDADRMFDAISKRVSHLSWKRPGSGYDVRIEDAEALVAELLNVFAQKIADDATWSGRFHASLGAAREHVRHATREGLCNRADCAGSRYDTPDAAPAGE